MLRVSVLNFLLFITAALAAQTHHFRNYGVDEGLPFVEVYAIHQDNKGYLWSGGYGGLSRFDGNSFVNFGPKDGLIDHYVTSISSDNDGKIWVGTISGLSVFDGIHFTNYTAREGLPGDKITSLAKDIQGRIWIGTQNGLCYSENGVFHLYDGMMAWKNEAILSLYNNSGTLWVGTNRGAYRILTTSLLKTAQFLDAGQGLVDTVVTSFAESDEGLFLGTPNGLTILPGLSNVSSKGNINISGAEGLPDNTINSLITDRKGNVWIATPGGLVKYANKEFTTFRVDNGSTSNRISKLFIDAEENLWIGTSHGLYRYSGGLFTSWSEDDGLKGEFVFSFLRNKIGELWVGTDKGINIMKGEHISPSGLRIPGRTIYAMSETQGGLILLGTDKGLTMVSGSNTTTIFPKSSGIRSDSVTSILIEKNGTIWLGLIGGIGKLENGKVSFIPLPGDASSLNVWCIYQDKTGKIWLGTYLGGLYSFDGTNIVREDQKMGIKSKSFLVITEDFEGNLFLGTFGGVFICRHGKVVARISEEDGLSSDLIYVMGCDSSGDNMWIGSNQGLNKLDLKEFFGKGKISLMHYGKEDGFLFGETNSGGFLREDNGTIWYGTVGGLIRYDPKEEKKETVETFTHIVSMRIFYRDTMLAQGAVLPWDQNNIAYNFIGICLTNPTKVLYSYKLEGFDKRWSPAGKQTFANYANLPPGKYTFLIRSANSFGTWNSKPTSFSFTVLTPFWKTWWFQVSMVVLFIGITLAVVRFRIKQVELREKNKAKLSALELKALRAQMNPHFIFNALNSIQHFIMNSDEDGATKYLNKFARLIRFILNNTERSTVSLEEEVDSLRLYIDLEVLRFENKFTYVIRIDSELNLDFYEVPTMLIQPYVENAILHGLVPKKTPGHLDIEFRADAHHIICTITDDGIGRKASREMKDRSAKPHHRSMGMRITHDRLELLNNVQNSNLSVSITDLTDNSGNAAGTKVQIFIPID